MTDNRTLLPALLAAALLGAGAATAQEPGSKLTRDYVQAAAATDAFELDEATSALAESRDPQVRAFAQHMLEEHHKTAEALREAAARSGLEPPVLQVDGTQSALLAALQSARGKDFDSAYWRHQALVHRAALVTTQAYAASSDTPAVRQTANAAVPIIAAHLATAERMVAAAGG